jgi:hypothetical protein
VGLAALVRMQNGLLLVVPLALWWSRCCVDHDRRAGVRRLAALMAGAAGCFSLQLAAWWRIYGSPVELPQGGNFLDLLRPHLIELLLSPWHGVFSWTPLLLLVVPGLWWLRRKDRTLAAAAAVAIALEVWLAASVVDWWAGYSVGARRLVDLSPVFIVALACVWERLLRRWPGRKGEWTVALVAGAGILWNVLLTLQVRTGLLSPFREVSMGQILGGQVMALGRLPRYLWEMVTRRPFDIHFVVHRDSPVSPALDPAPDWLVVLTLGACWLLGLVVIYLSRRRVVD